MNDGKIRLDEFMANLTGKRPSYRFYYRLGQNGEVDEAIVDAALICQVCRQEFVIEDVDAVLAALLCGIAPRFDCGKHQTAPATDLIQ